MKLLAIIAAVTFGLSIAPQAPPPPPSGAVYYIAVNGSDSNPGTQAQPWATPNHALNCSAAGGDTILVQPGTYSNGQFGGAAGTAGPFGPIGSGCSSHGVFRTLRCNGTLGACKAIDGVQLYPIVVGTPYWVVQGFEVTAPNFGSDGCMLAASHDIVFLNNWVHDCQRAGVVLGDYVAAIGVVNNNTGGQSEDSAHDVYEPKAFDTAAGTRIFVAGSFTFNSTKSNCDTDGEGIIFDDWSHSQNPPYQSGAYPYQGVVEQSLFVGNSSYAVEGYSSFWNSGGTVPSIWMRGVTTWNNGQNPLHAGGSGEVLSAAGSASVGGVLNIDHSLMVATRATNTSGSWNGTTCSQAGATNIYALYSAFGIGTVTNSDWVNTAVSSGNQDFGFSCCTNYYTIGNGNINGSNGLGGVDPQFTSPAIPSTTLSCAGYTTTTACMQGLNIISGFKAKNPAVAGMGYQPPGACAPDPYWPFWVPVGVVPDGLVTKPCT